MAAKCALRTRARVRLGRRAGLTPGGIGEIALVPERTAPSTGANVGRAGRDGRARRSAAEAQDQATPRRRAAEHARLGACFGLAPPRAARLDDAHRIRIAA